MKQIVVIMAALVVCGARPAAAQDAGSTGVFMGYPSAIGVIWHVTDTLALRPDISFGHISTSSDGSDVETSGNSYTLGLSALYYTSTTDKLRTYLSPQFAYGRATTDHSGGGGSKTSSNAYEVTGAFGAQYSLSARFGVYGEVGLAYSHSTSEFRPDSQVVSGKTKTNQFATRSAVGVILYFD